MPIGDYLFEYVSPTNQTIRFDPSAVDGPFFLLANPSGIIGSPQEIQSRRSPGQRGVTATNLVAAARRVALQVAILSDTEADYWARRDELARALVIEPPALGVAPSTGYLRIYRPGLSMLQLPVIPMAPLESARPGRLGLITDLEFIAPQPYWEDAGLSSVTLSQASGGFVFPLTFPFSAGSNNVTQNILNAGSVSTPITARLYGNFTNGRLKNNTTGETIHYTGNVPAGSHVRIETSFGKKSAVLVDSLGAETNVMANINVSLSSFWQLAVGSQSVTFEADTNVSGYATVTWRQRYVGI